MTRLRLFQDYPSQVRIFALLLILCLVIQLTGATYLYGRAKEHLARELEDRLQRAAGVAIKRLGPGPHDLALRSLQGVVEETGVSRIFLWGTAGSETIFGLGPPDEHPPMSAVEEARTGTAFLTDFYGDRRQGYYRALLVPLSPDSAGNRRVLGIEARTDLLGFLHRIRWVIIGGYTGGLLLALVLCALFVRSVLRPYARLTSVARDLRRAEGVVPQEGSVDIDFVVSTVQQATEALREKEGELSRLYAAERSKAETLDRYQQTILGSISSGVISFKPDLTIVVFNKTARQIFGIGEEEAVGRPCREVFGEDAEITAVAGEALRQQRIFSRLDLSVRRRDGALRRVGLSSSLLKGGEGNLVGLALLLTDLTEILQFREQAVMRDSLAALGQMSAGIAHEFRNSLGVIMGYAKLLQRNLPSEDSSHDYLQEIVSEIDLLEATLRDFLAFAKPMQLSRVAVGVKALTSETLDGFWQAMEDGKIKLVIDLPQEEVTVQADPYALRQALGNLIRNALEAMPGGGELAVKVRSDGAESGGAFGGRAGTVEIIVQDT
ncbi:MAG TPA: histidine kinase dimerization/phospho-acceptor domain-containing protein, partial [Anaerolineales bacterium]|nr:histidine kinase dimerization/phospho-acceptor domain-containing protein [Anaerolineales bacterium]